MFDEKTSQAIKSYVYMLIDPKDMKPFYIGKGVNNRVFDHVNCASYLDVKNDKLEKIREIKSRETDNEVEHIIIRHGLSDEVAIELEAAIIEVLGKVGYVLVNEQSGHHTFERGYMTTNDIIRYYNAEKLSKINHTIAIININKNNPRGKDIDSIYNATKQAWVIGHNSRKAVKYVLSEFRGLIVGVFEVKSWYQVGEPYISPKGKRMTRWGFDGNVCEDDEIKKLYHNKSVSHFKKRGNSNPVRIIFGQEL